MFDLAISDMSYFIQVFRHTLPQPPDLIKQLSLYLHCSRNCRKDLKENDFKNDFRETA